MAEHNDAQEKQADEQDNELDPNAQTGSGDEQSEQEAEGQQATADSEGKQKKEDDKNKDDEDGIYLDFDKPDSLTPDRVKARINFETRRKHDQDREIRELRETRERLEREMHELKKPQEVTPPSADLAYEDADKFKQQNEAYLKAERERFEWEHRNQQLEQQANQARESEKQQKVGQFLERAKKAGLDEQQLEVSAQIVASTLKHNVRSDADTARHQEIMRFVIDHDYGAQLLSDLAKDPAEMQAIASLSATQAAVKLNEKARSYQQSLKSKAPPPDDPLKGTGAPPESNFKHSAGGSFS